MLKTTMAANIIGHRLKMEMARQGLTSVELARRADVKTSFIYDIVNGKSSNPSTIKLAKVADTLGVSISYLVGTDSAKESAARAKAEGEFVAVPCLSGDGAAPALKAEAPLFRRSWLKERLGASPGDLRLFQVNGDGMAPTLCHRDIALVDITRTQPAPPGLFLVSGAYGLAIKRLELTGQPPMLRVISDNPKYSSTEQPPDSVTITGRVVWCAREV